ncbi:unnamed protein product [Chrysoparadoxa australica]
MKALAQFKNYDSMARGDGVGWGCIYLDHVPEEERPDTINREQLLTLGGVDVEGLTRDAAWCRLTHTPATKRTPKMKLRTAPLPGAGTIPGNSDWGPSKNMQESRRRCHRADTERYDHFRGFPCKAARHEASSQDERESAAARAAACQKEQDDLYSKLAPRVGQASLLEAPLQGEEDEAILGHNGHIFFVPSGGHKKFEDKYWPGILVKEEGDKDYTVYWLGPEPSYGSFKHVSHLSRFPGEALNFYKAAAPAPKDGCAPKTISFGRKDGTLRIAIAQAVYLALGCDDIKVQADIHESALHKRVSALSKHWKLNPKIVFELMNEWKKVKDTKHSGVHEDALEKRLDREWYKRGDGTFRGPMADPNYFPVS